MRWASLVVVAMLLTTGCLTRNDSAVSPGENQEIALPVSPLPFQAGIDVQAGLALYEVNLTGGPVEVTVVPQDVDLGPHDWLCFAWANHSFPRTAFGCRANLPRDRAIVTVGLQDDSIGVGPPVATFWDAIPRGSLPAPRWNFTLDGDEHYHLLVGTNMPSLRFGVYMNATVPASTTFVPSDSSDAAIGLLLSSTDGDFDERYEVWTPGVGTVKVSKALRLNGGLNFLYSFGTGPWIASIDAPSGEACSSLDGSHRMTKPVGSLALLWTSAGTYQFEATVPPHATAALSPTVLMFYWSFPGHHEVPQTPHCV